MFPNDDLHAKFGIDEIYFHAGLSYELLEKLYRRSAFSLDAEDPVALKCASHEMVLIFYKQVPSASLIRQFLKSLDQHKNKASYIEANTLVDEKELDSTLKSKTFVLVTHRLLVKETYTPATK